MDGKLLRERAWDLYLNNPWARSAIEAYIANVIECGIMPDLNDTDRENEYYRWGGLTAHGTFDCDITADQSINELQALWLREMLVGGGCLVHYVDRPSRSQRIPLSLEMMGENRFADHIQSYGTNPKTANPVVNGQEIETRTGRTVAYHVLETLPNDLDFNPEKTIRLKREHCKYSFIKDMIGAKRGTSLLKAVLNWLWYLGYYADNELKASDMKSAWAYMIKTDNLAALNDLNRTDGYVTDLAGNRVDHHEAGMIWHGSTEDDIKTVGPNVPGGDSLPWIMLIQRSIAVGCNVSYEEIFRDYSKTNFSSARMSRGQDKKRFKPMQALAICHFGNPTISRFYRSAVGAMIPAFPSPGRYLSEVDDILQEIDWQLPGWESPNPKEDSIANHQRLQDRTISRSEIVASEGRSWKKTLKYLEREEEALEEAGLATPAVGHEGALVPSDEDDDPENNSDDDSNSDGENK